MRIATVKKLGPDHPSTLRVLGNLAIAYGEGGRIPEAIRLFEQVRDSSEKKLGSTHPYTLVSLNNLGLAYLKAAKGPDAIRLLEQARGAQERTIGPDHPDILTTCHNLSQAYSIGGRNAEAVMLAEHTAMKGRDILGPVHPNTLVYTMDFIRLLEKEQQFIRAAQVQEELIVIQRKCVGPNDPRLACSLASLGSLLLKARKTSEAERFLVEALRIREELEPNAWTTFDTRSLLGASFLGQKKFAEAEPLLLGGHQGMKSREKMIPSEQKTRLIDAIDRLVDLYIALGKAVEVARWKEMRAK